MTTLAKWCHKPGRYQPGNDGTGPMKWFAHDTTIPYWRDDTETGRHRRFKSIEAAQRRANTLNKATEE